MAEVKGNAPSRSYGGQTSDERTAARRAALIEAAFALVAADGWRALRIDALCREAGLNKRYFYESFDGVDAVVRAVLAKLADDAIAVTLAAMEERGGTGAEVIHEAIATLVGHVIEDPRRARVLFGAVPPGDDAADHRSAAIRHVITTAAATGRTVFALDSHPRVDLAASMLVGGTSQAVLDWLDGRIACSEAELVEELAALWQGVADLAAGRSGWPSG